MSSPARVMVPAVGTSSPATIRRVVVLPHPDGPSSAKNEPCGTVTDRSSTATKLPNRFVSRSMTRSLSDKLGPDRLGELGRVRPAGLLRQLLEDEGLLEEVCGGEDQVVLDQALV